MLGTRDTREVKDSVISALMAASSQSNEREEREVFIRCSISRWLQGAQPRLDCHRRQNYLTAALLETSNLAVLSLTES